jgi:hypothetical protein
VRNGWCLAVLTCLLLVPRLRADAPAERVGPLPSVPRLIDQLGDSDYRRRDLAQGLLRTFGPDLLPDLRAAREHSDPEVRRRLDELITALETGAMLAPKRVTLNVSKKPLSQILEEVSKQTGYKIEAWNNNNAQQPYSFQFENVPFWEAIDRISVAGGLVLQQGYGDQTIRLQAQESYVPHLSYDGPFRLVANGFQQTRTVDFSLLQKTPTNIQRTDSLTFTFSIFGEPRIPLLGAGEPRLEAVYDNEQHSMIPQPGNANGQNHVTMRYGNGYRATSMQLMLTLDHPSEKARSIKLLKGSVPLTLLVSEKAEVVTDKLMDAKGKKFKAGDASFAIAEVTALPANNQYQVHMSITDESKDASDNDYTWLNSLYSRLEVQDAKGNKYGLFGSSWSNSNARHVDMTTTYGPQGNAVVGPPAKLVYQSWKTMPAQAAFTFKDLPLP